MKNSLFVYIEDQAEIILYSFLFGLFLAIVYDAVRLLRTFLGCGLSYRDSWGEYKLPIIGAMKRSEEKKKGRMGRLIAGTAAVFFFDIVYMIFSSASILLFMYAVSDGIVRSFSLISIALAFIIYMKTVGVLTKNAAGAILYVIRVIFRYILYFTVTPVLYIVKLVANGTRKLYYQTIGKLWSRRLLKRAEYKQSEYFEKTLQLNLDKITSAVSDVIRVTDSSART